MIAVKEHIDFRAAMIILQHFWTLAIHEWTTKMATIWRLQKDLFSNLKSQNTTHVLQSFRVSKQWLNLYKTYIQLHDKLLNNTAIYTSWNSCINF